LLAIPAAAQSQSVTIEKLVTDGWEIAGYIVRWPRLFGQFFRFDEWSLCRG
jgi:hypothetical protein